MSALLRAIAGLRPSFADPRWLAALALLPLVPLLARRSLAGLAGKRRALAVLVRALIVLLLVLSLAELQLRGKSDDLDVIFVLDRSLSLPPAAREAALRYVNETAAAADPRRDRGTLVVFGRNAAIEGRVGRDNPIAAPSALVDPDGTDIAGALRLAAAAFREGAGRRVVLVSDGNETEGDALGEAEALREAGVVLDVLPVRYRYEKEVLVERVVGPEAARIGEPFTLRVTLRSLGPARGTLRLLEDDQVVGSEAVTLRPGSNVFAFSRTAQDRGAHRYAAVIETEDDTLPGNNAAEHLVFVRGEGTTLYVPGKDGPTAALLDALAEEKFRVRTVSAASLPADLGGYADIDALVLDDVPAEALNKQQMAVLESAVHDLGVGLVMLGGDQSFGPGGWLGTSVEKALPVDMDVKQKKVIPKGALVMILHTCEFADGNVWAVRIAGAAVDALSSQDEVGLIDWGNGAGGGWGEEWVFPLQQAGDKPALKAAIRAAQPGDMPSFDTTVQMAHDGLAKSVASLKHILIITDADPQPPSPTLVRSLQAKKITMSAVAINPHGGRNGPEVKTLEQAARATGGRFYYVDDPKALPQIFTKEAVSVSRSLIVEEPFRAAPGVPSEVMKGLAAADLPPLKGYVMTTPKERAAVGLRTPQGDPLLAEWQYGVGKAAAFTSSVSARWAADWIGWPGYRAFVSQLLRAVAREVTDSPFDLHAEVQGGKGRLVLDAVDESGRFVNFLDVEAHVATPKLEHERVRFEQTAPGRYEALFDAKESGTFFANVIAKDGSGRIVAASGVAVENPYSLEYRKLASDERFLARLAEAGRGRVLRPEDAVFMHDVPAERAPRETWPLLLAIAVSLVPIDVAARRLVIDWARVRARVGAALGRRGAAPAPAEATMARLKGAKEAAGRAPAGAPKGGGFAAELHREGPAAAPRAPLEARPPPAVERRPEEAKPAEKPPPASDALARLLEAKKRARKRDGGKGDGS
jgi:uncharacterized membrane protein